MRSINFELPMTLNSYIALFFSLLFLGKFLLMDSRILLTFSDAGTVTYVNPFCEKQQGNDDSGNLEDFLEEDSLSANLNFDFLCHAPYNLEVFHWESLQIFEETRKNTHHHIYLPESAPDRFYPPPRV